MASTLIVIVTSTSFLAYNVLDDRVRREEFAQAKNLVLSISHMMKKVTLQEHSSEYVNTRFRLLIPQVVTTSDSLDLYVNDDLVSATPITVFKIQGSAGLYEDAETLQGSDALILTGAQESLEHVYVRQAEKMEVVLDCIRVRCVYLGQFDYFNGTAYERFNVVEVTGAALTVGTVQSRSEVSVNVYNHGLDSTTRQVAGNVTLRVAHAGVEASTSLTALGGDPGLNTLVTVAMVNLELSLYGD
jgi:hypothetical protein